MDLNEKFHIMHALLPVLEQVHFNGPFSADILNHQAKSLPAFSKAWLIQAISSDSSPTELCCALYWAVQNGLAEYEQLVAIWQLLFSERTDVAQVKSDLNPRLQALGLLLPCPESFFSLWWALQNIPRLTESSTELAKVEHLNTNFPPQLANQVIEKVAKVLQQTEVYTPHQVRTLDNVRNNQQYPTGSPCQDILFAAIERFVAYSLGKSLAFAEPLMIYRYGPGQEYKWHCDFIPDHHPQSQNELRLCGQRVTTAILYFNEDFTGGETAFKVWQREETGRLGSLIHFNNILPNGKVNPDSVHCGKPVLSGEKWIGTLWFRQLPIWTRNVLMRIN